MEPPEMRPPPTGELPLVYGPDHITEGYYELEELERGHSLDALLKHPDAVSLWYRALTLNRHGMLGTWEYLGDDGPGDNMTAWGLRMQLLGLGVGSAKATLDLLLAGYYSNAFAGIRHMVESVIQSIYLDVFPRESPMWFGKPGHFARELTRVNPDKKPPKNVSPSCKEMVDRITKESSECPQLGSMLDSMYNSWALMCKGAHPTSEGMRQTATADSAFHIIGATYVEDLCLTGFDHGLFAVGCQLSALAMLKPQNKEWTDKRDALSGAMGDWRHATAAKIGISPQKEENVQSQLDD